MGLPLYLAGSGQEIHSIPRPAFLMLDWTLQPPRGVLPVITDHRPLTEEAVDRLCRMAQSWERAVLDFERPPSPLALELLSRLPCPAAAPPGYGDGPVFLPPAPLHASLEEYLSPWHGREIWLEAALQKQAVTVTADGPSYSPVAPADLADGFDCKALRCRFTQEIREHQVVFTLFDTRETLPDKLDRARELGVHAALGLYCELGRIVCRFDKDTPL